MQDTLQNAAETLNAKGLGPVVILCEHASNHIPDRYRGLGLDDEARHSHAAWDPGARDVAVQLSKTLDAPLVASCISRLVYDCNRPPESASAMAATSERVEIPGNAALSEAERAERVEAAYIPFCNAVADVLERRADEKIPTALVTIHSFTPVFHGQPRAVEIGILHDSDTHLADLMLAGGANIPHRNIQRNAPYGPEDGVTHSLKLHGIARGLPNVMIEIRNDLIDNAHGVATLSAELLGLLCPALDALPGRGDRDA